MWQAVLEMYTSGQFPDYAVQDEHGDAEDWDMSEVYYLNATEMNELDKDLRMLPGALHKVYFSP